MTSQELIEERNRKQAIENSARLKFQQLPLMVQNEFKSLHKQDATGEAYNFLCKQGFSFDEAARFIMFVTDL